MEALLNFLYNEWFKLCIVIWLFWTIGSGGLGWIQTQIDWVKSFFGDPKGTKASSRRLMEFLVVITFIISYLKISIYNKDITDIPMTWAMLIVGILSLKTWDKISDKSGLKNGNGNISGESNGNNEKK